MERQEFPTVRARERASEQAAAEQAGMQIHPRLDYPGPGLVPRIPGGKVSAKDFAPLRQRIPWWGIVLLVGMILIGAMVTYMFVFVLDVQAALDHIRETIDTIDSGIPVDPLPTS